MSESRPEDKNLPGQKMTPFRKPLAKLATLIMGGIQNRTGRIDAWVNMVYILMDIN